MNGIVPSNIDIHGYADDHALKKAFSVSSGAEECAKVCSLAGVTKVIKGGNDGNRLK